MHMCVFVCLAWRPAHNFFFFPVSAPEGKGQTSVSRFKSKPSFNVRSVHVWRPGDIEAPQFDEENFEVAKYVVFEVGIHRLLFTTLHTYNPAG